MTSYFALVGKMFDLNKSGISKNLEHCFPLSL